MSAPTRRLQIWERIYEGVSSPVRFFTVLLRSPLASGSGIATNRLKSLLHPALHPRLAPLTRRDARHQRFLAGPAGESRGSVTSVHIGLQAVARRQNVLAEPRMARIGVRARVPAQKTSDFGQGQGRRQVSEGDVARRRARQSERYRGNEVAGSDYKRRRGEVSHAQRDLALHSALTERVVHDPASATRRGDYQMM